MKRITVIIISLIAMSVSSVNGQTYSINYDAPTIAAMTTAYTSNVVAEGLYNSEIRKILKHYKSAEVATAGIFSSKYLDRKALTDLGILASPTENYYYKRIYKLVSTKIIPKTFTVTKKLFKEPQQVLYWGPYIYKVCNDTKSLCMEFESIVTNSTLSFSDLPFPEMVPEIAAIMDLSKVGEIDWGKLFDELGSIKNNITLENFQKDFTTLYKKAGKLGDAMSENAANTFLSFAENDFYDGTLIDKIDATVSLVDKASGLYGDLKTDLPGTVMGLVGADTLLTNFFQTSDYNMTSWLNDYVNNPQNGKYYTQKWYIVKKSSGIDTLYYYYPPTSDDDIVKGSHWYRIETNDQSYTPSNSVRESILTNSESHAGFSKAIAASLNQSREEGTIYDYKTTLYAYTILRGGKLVKKAYAYELAITKGWVKEEIVYEDVFNSYTNNIGNFQKQMEVQLAAFRNDDEENGNYYIKKSTTQPFQPADNAKVKGSKSATISVTCHENVTLGDGTTQYKCSTCENNLTKHAKECSMYTSITEDSFDESSNLEDSIAVTKERIASVQAQIDALLEENNSLRGDASSSSVIQANNSKIVSLHAELSSLENMLTGLEGALEEKNKDEEGATDNHYRIPALMRDCRTAFNLTWQSDGTWQGNTFIRTATMPDVNGTITFRATISMQRKAQYFLGLFKIHRAIIGIDWELTSAYTSSHVEEVVELDPSLSDEQNAAIVNEHIAQIATQYPDCSIDTQYDQSDFDQEDDTEDRYHLLWASDRLEIARKIDTKIHKIYEDLVIVERFLNYKHSILDVLKDAAPHIDVNKHKKFLLLEKCRRRWLDNAAMIGGVNYKGQWQEGKYEDDKLENGYLDELDLELKNR